MMALDNLKSRIRGILNISGKKDEGAGVIYAPVEVLIKEQYNISGLNFFDTRSRDIMGGSSVSPFKGKGMEFDEVRIYQPGDDIRTVDWRVTARRGEAYTKLFREERERQVLILADMREKMHFATKGMFKSVMAARLSALIGWAALGAYEKVGGIVVSPGKSTVISPHRSRKKVLSLLNALSVASFDEAEDTAGNTLAAMLTDLRRVAKTGGIVFVISDWYDFDDDAKLHLTQICGRCDVVAIDIIDRLEEKAPPKDRYLITDGKKTQTLFADDYLWREGYEAFFRERREKFDEFCRKRGIISLRIKTEDNPAEALRNSFYYRRR